MTQRLLSLMVALILMSVAAAASSYDATLAASYARLFEPVKGQKAGKALHLIKVKAFVEQVQAGKPMVMLDIRTPAETAIFSAALPGHLTIPLNALFEPENLDRIPTDTPVIVFCQTGTRAAAAGTALRHIGFENVLILKGGFKALNDYLDPTTANPPAAEPRKE